MLQGTALGADDAGGNRLGQAKGVADRHDPLTDLQAVTVPQLRHRQFFLVTDPNQSQIKLFIKPLDLPFQLPAIREFYHHLIGTVDHMVVCQDITVTADDEAGPQTLFTPRALLGRLTKKAAEKIIKKIIAKRVLGPSDTLLGLNVFGGSDIDHRRLETF